MNKYDKEFLRKLANQLMFDMTDEELENVQAEFVVLEKQLELLEAINTDGVEEMIYPFEDETFWYLIGRFIGDGWVVTRKERNN